MCGARAQFAVGEDEEIAAAAGGVEELEGAEPLVKAFQGGAAAGGAVAFHSLPLGA